jgi:hypothetical protein
MPSAKAELPVGGALCDFTFLTTTVSAPPGLCRESLWSGLWGKECPTAVILCRPERAASRLSPEPSWAPAPQSYLMMLEASSASGSAQYLLARIRHASADSI